MNTKGLAKGWVILSELQKEIGLQPSEVSKRMKKPKFESILNQLGGRTASIIVKEKPFLAALVNSYERGYRKAELMAKIDKYMEGKDA